MICGTISRRYYIWAHKGCCNWRNFLNKSIVSSLFYSASYNSNNTLLISLPIKMSFRFANCNINRASLIANKSISMLDSKKLQNLEFNTEFWQTINSSIFMQIMIKIIWEFIRQVWCAFNTPLPTLCMPDRNVDWRTGTTIHHRSLQLKTARAFSKH